MTVVLRRSARLVGVLGVLLTAVVPSIAAPAAATTPRTGPLPAIAEVRAARWHWPVPGTRVIGRAYEAPADAYAAGHRGVDVVAHESTTVLSPVDGVVAFAGAVAARGVLVIDAGDGLLATLEPVESTLIVGSRVAAGAAVGSLSTGGHALPGALHLGARLEGVYLNPLLLLGGGARIVLLPCCE